MILSFRGLRNVLLDFIHFNARSPFGSQIFVPLRRSVHVWTLDYVHPIIYLEFSFFWDNSYGLGGQVYAHPVINHRDVRPLCGRI